MTVILKRSWVNNFGRKYPIGQKINCDRVLGNQLIADGYAEAYTGDVRKKVRVDFFKPKL